MSGRTARYRNDFLLAWDRAGQIAVGPGMTPS